MRPSRARASASSKQIGSSLRLPLVITSASARAQPRAGTGVEQQVVHGRVRQQHTDERVARRDAAGSAMPSSRRRSSTIGRCGLVRSAASCAVDHREPLGCREIARPSPRTACRMRLLRARSSPTAASTSRRRPGGSHRGPSPRRPFPSPAPAAPPRAAASVPSTDRRRPSNHRRGPHAAHATGCAWNRRSAGSSYCAAHTAHSAKLAHRRVRPVVREPQGDREPGSAVGAVDERIAVATVGGIEELDAGSRHTRRHRATRTCGPSTPAGLSTMRKPRSPTAACGHDLDAVDAGQRRRARRPAAARSRLTAGGLTLDLDEHAVVVVADVARRGRGAIGQPVHERPEAHALHDAAHAHPGAHERRGRITATVTPGGRA